MPNWCDNRLVITGPSAAIDEIVGAQLSLMKLVPPPDGNWDYGWCCAHWGTKWDIGPLTNISVSDEDHGKKRIDVRFGSAWSPPVEALESIYAKYPGLYMRLEYIETGMMFLGVMEGFDGDTYNNNYDYKDRQELETIAKELQHDLAFDEIQSMIEWEERETEADNERGDVRQDSES